MEIPSWNRGVRLAGFVFAGLAMARAGLGAAGGRTGTDVDLYAGAGAIGGMALLAVGFVLLHKKRVIENVPCSRIRSVAMGFAELSGTVRNKVPVVAPLSGIACVFYRFLIEQEERSSRGGSHWSTVEEGQSAEWFYLDDPTGTIVVDPDGVDAELGRDYRNIERDGGFFSRKKRYTEWRLHGGERAYVVGTVRSLRNLAQEKRAALTDRLRELKHDPARLKAFDTDHDGQISTEEWGNAVRVVQTQVLKEEVARPSGGSQDDLIISKGEAEATFVLSDKGERAIVRTLAWQSALALAGGAALTLAGALMLLARAGALGKGVIVSW